MVDEEEVIAQRARAVASLTLPMMLANILNSCAALLVLYIDDQLIPQAVLWATIAIVFSGYTILRNLKYRGKPFPTRLGPDTVRRTTLRAVALGLLFAYPGAIILPATTGTSQAFFVALAAGTVAAGTIALYAMPAAALAFGLIVAFGSLLGFATVASATIVGFAASTIMFFIVVYISIRLYGKLLVSEVESRRALDRQNKEIGLLLEKTRAEAIAERKKAETRLVQAQKMEAIGQLTGGIAHDFNNLLATIQGHTELLAMEPGTDETLTGPILRSTRSGAELTRRLLTFARRQTLKPQPVDLHELTDEMDTLLARTLRENVSVKTELSADIWPVFADPNLLANALLNLANNARDAMPKGGVIHITAQNLAADKGRDAVAIRVSDTGTGMSESVKARAFEPFFTTKEFGQGSGLGLSMVHGFAEQSGGALIIDSTPGAGTTIELRIPRAANVPDTKSKPQIEDVLRGTGERILIVEDNPDVRMTVSRLLASLDYVVQSVESVAEARTLLDTIDQPDIILSDIVLPGGTSGTEFARDLATKRPEIGVLLMSGYPNPDTSLKNDGRLDFELLPKPFDKSDLAAAIYACRQRARTRRLKAGE